MRSFICLAVLAILFPPGARIVLGDDAPADWDKLVKEKEVSLARLAELKQQFQVATQEEKIKIRDEYRDVTKQFESQVIPQLVKLLPARLEQNPDEQAKEVAAEIIQIEYSRNHYADVNQISDVLLKKDPTNQIAANLGGAAKFALHDFSGAVNELQQAEKAGTLDPQLGAHYLELAKKYVDYWNKEQEIRAKEAAAPADQKLPRVRLETSKGEIVLELFENEAPNTVANFISLVESKFYDGTKFHRVIEGFMAQGGSPLSRDADLRDPRVGGGGPGYTIKCECDRPDARQHFAGSISMAHAGKDTGGSQFFITHLPTDHLNGIHTVFGRVVKGMDVVYELAVGDEINAATVLNKRNHPYKPVTTPEPQ